MPQAARLSILGFAGGFLAVLIFHQSLWFLFNQIGLIPWERPAWPFDPIPPFGVPSVISKAFWGRVWGAVLAPLLSTLRGRATQSHHATIDGEGTLPVDRLVSLAQTSPRSNFVESTRKALSADGIAAPPFRGVILTPRLKARMSLMVAIQF